MTSSDFVFARIVGAIALFFIGYKIINAVFYNFVYSGLGQENLYTGVLLMYFAAVLVGFMPAMADAAKGRDLGGWWVYWASMIFMFLIVATSAGEILFRLLGFI